LNTLLLFTLIFIKINNVSSFLPENGILIQTVSGDCTGDLKEETIIVYDLDERFGTTQYKGTCVVVLREIEEEYTEVYKSRLSADTKVRLVKVFDELPPFIEVQWFRADGGGNTYIYYDAKLDRFSEIFNFESGGINREDIDWDGKDEIFAFTFESIDCGKSKDEIYASYLTFYRWTKNGFVTFPEHPYMMRPGMTYFATEKVSSNPKFVIASPGKSNSPEHRGTEDISFKFFSTMDSTVSITLLITDDHIVQNRETKNIIIGDHLILLLDTDLEGDFCKRTVDEDDIAIIVSPGNFEDISPEIVNVNPSSKLSAQTVKNSDFLIEKKLGGYEIRINLKLPKKIFRKGLFGLGFVLYDKDKENSDFPENHLVWPDKMDKKDPTTWGNLYLFGK
jgi:hypothetical protein